MSRHATIRSHLRITGWTIALLVVALLVAASCCGCGLTANTPYGSVDTRTGPLYERKTTTKTTTSPAAVIEEGTCENGVCRPAPIPPK